MTRQGDKRGESTITRQSDSRGRRNEISTATQADRRSETHKTRQAVARGEISTTVQADIRGGLSKTRQADRRSENTAAEPFTAPKGQRFLEVRGARTNNLKNIDVKFPLKKFTIVTGVSGSGKSSLVFDTIYAEGQRRYVESLSTYTRQFLEKMPKPDIDGIDNVSPAIALEQKNHINNSRSTVATMSEIYDYLRLLFAKVGQTYCVRCGLKVRKDTSLSVAEDIAAASAGSRFYILSILTDTPLAKEGSSTRATTHPFHKEWPQTRKALVASGFDRTLVVLKGQAPEPVELTALEKLPAKLQSLYLVIDRMSRPDEPTKDHRLMDALDQAFQHGNGRMAIAYPAEEGAWKIRNYSDRFRCDECDLDYRTPEPHMLSFNSPLGACSQCSGFGFTLELSENIIVPDKRKTLRNGAIDPFTKPAYSDYQTDLMKFCEKHKISTGKRYEDLSPGEKQLVWEGDGAKRGYPGIRGVFEELKGWKYKMHVRIFIRRYQDQVICPVCHGSRLRPEVKAVQINGRSIVDALGWSIEDCNQWFKGLTLTKQEAAIAKDVLNQVQGRLEFLNEVGVGYLTLNRLGKTLSGGECQRINLASQLGNRLCSTLYVLDEPSIGLHPADTDRLIGLLHKLRDHGNTVVVVEHDLEVVSAADYMVELGPHAGHRGGEVVAQGELKQILKDRGSLTAKYLTGDFRIEKRPKYRAQRPEVIKITGACENNLSQVDIEFPLHQLVAITGLSGSGKTTLIHRTLYNALHRLFHKENVPVGRFQRLYGADLINDVVMLDQKPIGRTSRSNPATYLKIYDDIRKIYANQSLSIKRGYEPKHFLFNVDGGRCPVCKGEGEVTIDMHFMAEIKLPCEECEGRRFQKKILDVEFKKKSIAQLLNTTIDECIDLFREYPAVTSKLQILHNVGLGYLHLGQSGTTLSGGESQRLKIASVLTEKSATNVLYIFDEPTTGLHIDDVKRLLSVLHDLVDQNNSVIVIEHNIDLIAQADHVIDLGPGGGKHGGSVVAKGTPEEIMNVPQSLTGRFLKRLDAHLKK